MTPPDDRDRGLPATRDELEAAEEHLQSLFERVRATHDLMLGKEPFVPTVGPFPYEDKVPGILSEISLLAWNLTRDLDAIDEWFTDLLIGIDMFDPVQVRCVKPTQAMLDQMVIDLGADE